ncbi:unnamed protein product [Lasius platythorax]|uniref:DNA repair and recombination protein RAD54-like n=1 Tax=Lasius platythorax TaxID=488582 RepID=A0AAV2NAK9_9HYME
MYRNKSVKGFISPLIIQSRTNVEESKVYASWQETPSDSVKKPLRSNAQLVNIFKKANPENEVIPDNIDVENNSPKKRDASSSVYEKNTSIIDLPQTESKIIFNVLYGRTTSKKHQTWDGDGFLEVTGKSAILKDLDGKVMGRKTINPSNAVEGSRLIIGNKQIEIKDQVSQELPVPEGHSEERIEEPLPKKFKTTTGYVFVLPKKEDTDALVCKKEASSSSTVNSSPAEISKISFNVMYGQITSKKHKTWDGDGLLEITGESAILKDLNGKVIGRKTINPSNAVEGARLMIGNKQIEIIDQVSQEKHLGDTVEKMVQEKVEASTDVFTKEGLKFLRLDGTISSSARSKVIEQFNTRSDNSKVLLLSAKAGGVGLNLPGASRLVLFDSDWNPASDMQAMARIWRDGQKKNVYIYRLLTTGTIEEKIYQRQISKASLSESVVDLNHLGSLKLSTAELKDLFTLATDTVSLTHDLLNCSCSGQDNGSISSEESKTNDNEIGDCQLILDDKPSQQNLTINQLRDWQHYKQPIPFDIMQDIMLTEAGDYITFIFKNSKMQHTQTN